MCKNTWSYDTGPLTTSANFQNGDVGVTCYRLGRPELLPGKLIEFSLRATIKFPSLSRFSSIDEMFKQMANSKTSTRDEERWENHSTAMVFTRAPRLL